MSEYLSHIPPRPADYANGITTEYKGFIIDDRFVIRKDGKVITFPQCWLLQQAKNTIDASNDCKLRQMPDKQAALKKLTTSCELENGQEESDRFTEWMELQSELQLKNDEI